MFNLFHFVFIFLTLCVHDILHMVVTFLTLCVRFTYTVLALIWQKKLLQIAFGEAGSEIIGVKKRAKGGEINPMVSSCEKVKCK